MNKADLEDKMVVEYRNGERRIVSGATFMGETTWVGFSDYNDDLTSRTNPDRDIMKIFGEVATLDRIKTTKYLIWERVEKSKKVEIIYAQHFGNKKVYQWINDKKICKNLAIGDIVEVETSLGNKVVEIVDIRMEEKTQKEVNKYKRVVGFISKKRGR